MSDVSTSTGSGGDPGTDPGSSFDASSRFDAILKAKAPIIGIVGWKNSGKTGLAIGLVQEFSQRGLRVATIKHAHHALRLDDEATDSARHRRAGAGQVAVVSTGRWALITETPENNEPDFIEVVGRLDDCDLIVVEGYKSQPIPKIETRRREASPGLGLAERDPNVWAIASDYKISGAELPVFLLDDISPIADFIAERLGL